MTVKRVAIVLALLALVAVGVFVVIALLNGSRGAAQGLAAARAARGTVTMGPISVQGHADQ